MTLRFFAKLWFAVALTVATSNVVVAQEVVQLAMKGDAEALRTLLKQETDVNEVSADGSTALHWSVYNDDLSSVRLLISKGAKIQVRTREGIAPIDLAALNGNAEMIAALLKAGADVDGTMPNGETPLMMAARTGRTQAIQVLLDAGADIDAKENLRGTNALMWAAANSRADAVKLLIKAGSNLSTRSAPTTLGRKPYLAQTAKSRIDQVAAGIDVSGVGVQKPDKEEEEADVSNDVSIDDNDPNSYQQEGEQGGGLTALIFATREGDMQSVRHLVEGGADVNETSRYGWSPLLTAVQNRYYQLARYLLEQGADPNIANEGGWSPLYIATDNRNIENGDYPTRRPDMDHLELIRLLLDKGADPNIRMKSSTETRTIFTHQWLHEEGATPFLRAAQSGDLVLMKLLMKHGADPGIATDIGVTPLMVASGIGWVEGVTYEWSRPQTIETVKFLIGLGADVNAQDEIDLRTALMGAAHKGDPEVIQILVDHGADMSLNDVGSRDTIHKLAGITWQAIDYADGLVRVGVQSATPHPEASALLRKLMVAKGLDVPPEDRTLDSICITKLCQ